MKILVAVKRVNDYNVQVRVKEDNTGVVTLFTATKIFIKLSIVYFQNRMGFLQEL